MEQQSNFCGSTGKCISTGPHERMIGAQNVMLKAIANKLNWIEPAEDRRHRRSNMPRVQKRYVMHAARGVQFDALRVPAQSGLAAYAK